MIVASIPEISYKENEPMYIDEGRRIK